MAFAARSPIFDIEYSYEPHDALIFASFTDIVLCPIFIPIDILHYIAWRKRKTQRIEENKRQAKAVGRIKDTAPKGLMRKEEKGNEKQEARNEIQETRNEIQETGYRWEVSMSDKIQ